MDGKGGYYIKWNKPKIQGWILHTVSHMWKLKKLTWIRSVITEDWEECGGRAEKWCLNLSSAFCISHWTQLHVQLIHVNAKFKNMSDWEKTTQLLSNQGNVS
jgi:hypothetical protein